MGKRKKVNYELIAKDSDAGQAMYPLLSELVEAHHEHLIQARIALAWNTGWSPDADGRLVLGKCKKASDLDRELAEYDFVIMLFKPFWEDGDVTDQQRRALLDHELCHAGIQVDTNGEPKRDERDRIVYRLIKHDVEEFSSIVHRHGVWKGDLERFAIALQASRLDATFKPCADCRQTGTPGWQRVVVDGATRLARCECYLKWLAGRQAWSGDGAVSPEDVARAAALNPGSEAVKRFQDTMTRDGSGVSSIEMTTVVDGRRKGTRITKDGTEPIDRPAHAHSH